MEWLTIPTFFIFLLFYLLIFLQNAGLPYFYDDFKIYHVLFQFCK